MLWVDNRKKKEILFQDVSIGEVFLYDDILFLRTDNVGDYNAVSLDSGEYDHFYNSTKVEMVEVRLEIVG